jgi:selenide,water dikinase
VLTRPLGTGVMLAADMRGLLPGARLQALLETLARPNVDAARLADEFGATACTDVSGFGLAGHASALARASGVSVRLFAEAIPAWPAARDLLARGVRSTYHEQNARPHGAVAVGRGVAPLDQEILFDPQTAGGLLFGVDAMRAAEAVRAIRAAGDAAAAIVGVVAPPRGDGALIELAARGNLDNARTGD